MAKISYLKKFNKTFKRPKNPYERKRYKIELIIIGKFGLKNKKELWRHQLILSKIRLLAGKIIRNNTHLYKIPLQKYTLLWFCYKYNLIKNKCDNIDLVLSVNLDSLMKRRIQFLVHKKNISRTVHQARLLIMHKNISIKNQVVSKPNYLIKKGYDRYLRLSILSLYYARSPWISFDSFSLNKETFYSNLDVNTIK